MWFHGLRALAVWLEVAPFFIIQDCFCWWWCINFIQTFGVIDLKFKENWLVNLAELDSWMPDSNEPVYLVHSVLMLINSGRLNCMNIIYLDSLLEHNGSLAGRFLRSSASLVRMGQNWSIGSQSNHSQHNQTWLWKVLIDGNWLYLYVIRSNDIPIDFCWRLEFLTIVK